MLIFADRLHKLDFRQLMDVYVEGNLENARQQFSREPEQQWLLLAEQSFYQFLQECFFTTPGAVYAVWIQEGRYVSALRLEPYEDGMLLEALETAPQQRRKGYGEALVREVCKVYPETRIYSHVSKGNIPSLRLHEKCGFYRVLEHAVYADGSVYSTSVTFCSHLPEDAG